MHTAQTCRSMKAILYNTLSPSALCALGKTRCMRSDEELSVCGIVVAPRCSGFSDTLDFRFGNSNMYNRYTYHHVCMYICVHITSLSPTYYPCINHLRVYIMYPLTITYYLSSTYSAPTYLHCLYIYYL